MKKFLPDLSKYRLEYLESMELCDYTDDDIRKLIGAFAAEQIAPSVPFILFERENINKLLSLSKCKRCGKCCLPDKTAPENPGVIVGESDMMEICKNAKHSLKSLKKIVRLSENPKYHAGALFAVAMYVFQQKR